MLYDKKIKLLKPGAKRIRKCDGDGLYIIIEPSGRKYFVYEYKYENKIKRKTLGDFLIDLNVKEAREVANNFKKTILENEKQYYSFDFLVDKYLKYQSKILKPLTFHLKENFTKKYILQYFKNKYIHEINRQDILNFLKSIESLNTKTYVKKAYNILNQIFNFCYMECEINPCSSIKISFIAKKYKVEHHPVISKDSDIAKLIQDINNAKENNIILHYAIKFMLLTALRSNNVCKLEWREIDLDDNTIEIKAFKMKNNRDFKLPLSKQAKNILLEIKQLKNYNSDKFVFYRIKSTTPIYTQDVSRFLQRLGYTNIMRPHSFRTLFSTICNENRREHKIFYDVIEKCLAHYKHDIRAVYNRADNFEDMRFLTQWYADYLDKIENFYNE
ncbi:site-specific integrase [Campylobacter sp. RM12651]|uniref:tyrosine-type recombinase/integrase n=1 Tax=Campylobacter sp. RM12651 TaxID=1660079 RepID=UPI001EFAC3B3|nr:site-specific integrase [Campylobacter sp. RM12651]ULO03725.1 site-specific tyrosine recombinase, phage integrase family (INT_P4_C, DUF4102 domains) [Campylobacter sp. RM12651]